MGAMQFFDNNKGKPVEVSTENPLPTAGSNADGSSDVKVTNTSDEPIPVQGSVEVPDGVKVTNTDSEPVPVDGEVTVNNDSPIPVQGNVQVQGDVQVPGGVKVTNTGSEPVPVQGDVQVTNTVPVQGDVQVTNEVIPTTRTDKAIELIGNAQDILVPASSSATVLSNVDVSKYNYVFAHIVPSGSSTYSLDMQPRRSGGQAFTSIQMHEAAGTSNVATERVEVKSLTAAFVINNDDTVADHTFGEVEIYGVRA